MINSDTRVRALRASEVFRKHGIAQSEIAKFVGASQPQVSRLLAGHVSRTSRLFEEVCLYAERLEGGVTIEMVRSNVELMSALSDVWDGTAVHAKALSMVIRSLTALRLVASTTQVDKQLPFQ